MIRDEAAAAPADPLESVLRDYDFELPEDRIAQTALAEREASRLLVVARETGSIVEPERDHRVRDLPQWLSPGDLLVVNATRVVPARLLGRKKSGGLAEALLLGRDESPGARPGEYRALVKLTGRVRPGLALEFRRPEAASGEYPVVEGEIVALHGRGEVTLRFGDDVDPHSVGIAPLPPYIRRAQAESPAADLERYQTVFAREPGAIAAPTAGLHLTQPLLARLRAQGVETAELVLHVGAGTFRPLDEAAWTSGRLHRERFELPDAVVAAIDRTRAAGGRIVAVGTTTTRVLESCVDARGSLRAGSGETDLFLRPGARFRVVDALLTNFHLPRSSLLMLVAAFVGREAILAAYRHAIAHGFRFYSYGDAMLILPSRGAAHAR
ncbi:MAG: tRNA preQ1(34) S-adenosylmethionine ribosyltransferase-isomerase QueA [Myxococcota bacterium]